MKEIRDLEDENLGAPLKTSGRGHDSAKGGSCQPAFPVRSPIQACIWDLLPGIASALRVIERWVQGKKDLR